MDPDFLHGTPDQLRFLSAREAAEFLRLSPSTLAKLRMRGDGPAYHKLARKVVYSRDELIDWIGKFRRTNTSQASATRRHPAGNSSGRVS